MSPANHVAIIMDGNGRWAQTRGKNRTYGHIRGAWAAKNIIKSACAYNLKYLTLFAFSTENWFRPSEEVQFLMRLLNHQILRQQKTLVQNNIQFQTIGDLSQLPPAIQQGIAHTKELTKNNTGLVLTFGLNYGGRQEIIDACQKLSQLVSEKKISSTQINESLFEQFLPSSFLPDPDLIIRTSGEQRISNFMLWQSAYSEFYFTPVLWPDFSAQHLAAALAHYSSRTRRFGRLTVRADEVSP